MFYHPIPSPPAAEEEVEEEKYVVKLRRNDSSPCTSDDGHQQEALSRPRTWSKACDNLSKIDEGEDETDHKNNRSGYNLSGYLYKISLTSHKKHVPTLRGLGSSPKKRWFVYSDSVCKLYYYKQKNDSEPLGMIDIALATLFFDPENKNEGQFSIR